MKNFIKLVTQVKNDLIKAKGQFILFALIKLDSSKRWDIVVCADWLSCLTERDAVCFIVNELKKKVTREDFVYFSRVVVLKKDEPFMAEIQNVINSENVDISKNGVVLKNKTILHLNIKEMRVLQINYNQEINRLQEYIAELVKAELVKQQIEQVKAQMYQSYLSSKNNVVLSEINEDKVTSKQSNNVIDFQEEYEKRKVEQRWQMKTNLLNLSS